MQIIVGAKQGQGNLKPKGVKGYLCGPVMRAGLKRFCQILVVATFVTRLFISESLYSGYTYL